MFSIRTHSPEHVRMVSPSYTLPMQRDGAAFTAASRANPGRPVSLHMLTPRPMRLPATRPRVTRRSLTCRLAALRGVPWFRLVSPELYDVGRTRCPSRWSKSVFDLAFRRIRPLARGGQRRLRLREGDGRLAGIPTVDAWRLFCARPLYRRLDHNFVCAAADRPVLAPCDYSRSLSQC